LLQQVYGSWTGIRGDQVSLRDALYFLDQPLPDYLFNKQYEKITFNNEIKIINLSFRYEDNLPSVFHNLNFSIKKGDRVGFIGTTGSGKSTLMDLLMGLIEPSSGEITVDDKSIVGSSGRSWQKHIAHVPQSIYLADATIAENIAFGVSGDHIDVFRVKNAARRAQIDSSIESLPFGYKTLVGERGVRLSGGQRQRIGIARALYRDADVIFFDEATSALDSETESAVMDSIQLLSKDLTILIVAHRLSTLKGCTKIIELREDGGYRLLTYRDIVAA
jgi:ATP-binding cassette subfamily B protein